MAKLEGYVCDTCGEKSPALLFDALPGTWYLVLPPRSGANAQYFCSKACLAAAATGTGPVEIPEKPRVLFVKWIKALVR